jgi:excisionase family DNA binding protein
MEKRIKIEKICQQCGQSFTARKTTTAYCSHACASKAYKHRKRDEWVSRANEETAIKQQATSSKVSLLDKPFLSPTECAELLGVSRATVYRYLRKNELKCVQFSGRTKIRRSDIEEMFNTPAPYKTRPVISQQPITEFYTIQEIKEKYHVQESWIFKVAKEKEIPKILKRGRSYLSKFHVDKAFAHKQSDESITKWYTVAEIKEEFGMTDRAIYTFAYEHNIPKKKTGRNTHYSKFHVDKAKGLEVEQVAYYSVAEAMEKFNLTRDMLYHYVRAYNIPKVKAGRYIKIQQKELDEISETIIT